MKTCLVCALTVLFASLTMAVRPAAAQGSEPRWSIGADVVTTRITNSPAPVPLVSTAPLGTPDVAVMLGGQDIKIGAIPGVRITVGRALGAQWRLDAAGSMSMRQAVSARVQSSGQVGSQRLDIPYFNPVTNLEASTGLARPGDFSGLGIERLTTRVAGGHAGVARDLVGSGTRRLELLIAGRLWRMHEDYRFTTDSPDIPPAPVDVFNTFDEFDASNTFAGGDAALRATMTTGRLSIRVTGGVAAGGVRQSVDVSGQLVSNTFTDLATVVTYPGGYFAQPTNIGRHARTTAALLPHMDATIAWRLAPRVALRAGYDVLALTRAARAADQLSHRINPTGRPALNDASTPVSGPAEPVFTFRSSSVITQSLSFGAEFGF